MAKFDQAYKYTSAIEAGYVVDNGGPTYKGISYKGWGNDPFAKKIFAIVFAAKPRKGGFIKNAALDQLIIAFYKKNYWDKIYGDYINNQTLANFIYDFTVNSGGAIPVINKVIGSVRGTDFFTESTLAQLNAWATIDGLKSATDSREYSLVKYAPSSMRRTSSRSSSLRSWRSFSSSCAGEANEQSSVS